MRGCSSATTGINPEKRSARHQLANILVTDLVTTLSAVDAIDCGRVRLGL